MSLAVTRNAALRAALGTRWPQVSFTVRNGPAGAATIGWTDGPSESAVRRVTAAVPGHPAGVPWKVALRRTMTAELVAASFIRERAAGRDDYLRERDADGNTPARGDLRPGRGLRIGFSQPAADLDAADVTTGEWDAARLAVSLTQLPTTASLADRSLALARIVHHRGHVLDTVLR